MLLYQFHAILPGTSIAWVHREVAERHAALRERIGAIRDAAIAALVESVKMAAEQMDRAEDLIAVQYTNDMKQYVGQQISLAMKGDISAKEALDKAVDYGNKAL